MPISENHIKGCFQVARSLFDSHIWCQMPTEYSKIWIYLLGKASHSGRKYNGYYCEKGQYFCTYNELLEQLSTVNQHCSKSKIKSIFQYLRKHLMITTQRYPRGVVVSICNYETYQEMENYLSTTETPTETPIDIPSRQLGVNRRSPSINKNDKELKNERSIISIFDHWNSLKIMVHRKIDKFKPTINNALKDYSEEEIKNAMVNLKKILDGEYFYNYSPPLDNFLKTKLDQFIDANDPIKAFGKTVDVSKLPRNKNADGTSRPSL